MKKRILTPSQTISDYREASAEEKAAWEAAEHPLPRAELIRQWEAVGARYGEDRIRLTYNPHTGLFGIKFYEAGRVNAQEMAQYVPQGISADEATKMLHNAQGGVLTKGNYVGVGRVNLPPYGYYASHAVTLSVADSPLPLLVYDNVIEMLVFHHPDFNAELSAPIQLANAFKLKAISGQMWATGNKNAFSFGEGLPELEYLTMYLYGDVYLRHAPKLSLYSLQWLVTNARNTTQATVWLHPDAFARLTDSLIAEAATKNITFIEKE